MVGFSTVICHPFDDSARQPFDRPVSFIDHLLAAPAAAFKRLAALAQLSSSLLTRFAIQHSELDIRCTTPPAPIALTQFQPAESFTNSLGLANCVIRRPRLVTFTIASGHLVQPI